MSDIFRQVDEDLRKDRLKHLWQKYGLYLILVIVLVLLLVTGFQLKKSFDLSNNEKIVETYINAVNKIDYEDTIIELENIIKKDNSYISGLADLKISSLLIENGMPIEAFDRLKKISKNEAYDQVVTQFADYLILLQTLEINDQVNQELNNRNKIEENSFTHLNSELLGIKYLLSGEKEKSKKQFEAIINNPAAPLDIKIRSNKFLELID
tara:strand:+ start:1438 stop:2067 length:630 start_codon:yes stop_codon:yes gene_type:complete